MVLNDKEINRLKTKHKQSLKEMEHYDDTFEKLWGRERVDLTLDKKVIIKLRKMRERTGKPISRIVEDAVAKI
tara:strand:+ start:37 stop:255 length:219 start_codon:yes stop_codon:yes gene_type:complete